MRHSGPFFDLLALPYEWVTRHEVWEQHCARMAHELPAGARRVLDLGCGPGNSSAHLRSAVGPGVVAADVSMPMLQRARKRDARLPLLQTDATHLPFRDAALDAVTFHSVLYLLPDRRAALREVHRVLRPGGRAVLLEPQEGLRATALGLARALPRPRWALCAACWRTASKAYGRFTQPGLREHLETAGLRVLSLRPSLGGLALLAVAER